MLRFSPVNNRFFNSWNHLYTWHKFGIDLGYLLRSKSLCFDMFPFETSLSKLDSISSRIQAICKKERISYLSKRGSAVKNLLSLQTKGSYDTHWYCCLVSKFQQHYFKLSNNLETDYFRFLNTHCSWQSSWEKLRIFVHFKGLIFFNSWHATGFVKKGMIYQVEFCFRID